MLNVAYIIFYERCPRYFRKFWMSWLTFWYFTRVVSWFTFDLHHSSCYKNFQFAAGILAQFTRAKKWKNYNLSIHINLSFKAVVGKHRAAAHAGPWEICHRSVQSQGKTASKLAKILWHTHRVYLSVENVTVYLRLASRYQDCLHH